LALSPSSFAASIVAWDVPTLTSESTVVVDATVVSTRSSRQADGMITTRTELAVSETLKGDVGSTLVLHQLGGTVGEWTLTIAGDLVLSEGDRVLLFATEDAGKFYPTLLAWSGFFVEGEGLNAPVRRSVEGLQLFDLDENGVLRATEDPVVAPQSVGALRDVVLRTVAGGAR
jgi:hypothetical protein